jgi:hypothetical protein
MEIEEDCLLASANPNQRHENLRFRLHFKTRFPHLVVIEIENPNQREVRLPVSQTDSRVLAKTFKIYLILFCSYLGIFK